jgi:hypothetical protein
MASSGQLTPALHELLAESSLAGDWILEQAESTIGLQSRVICGLIPVKGTFGQVTGHGTVSPAGGVSGAERAASTGRQRTHGKHRRPRNTEVAHGSV